MKELMESLSALNGILEAAKNIPHTPETLSERRNVLRKCNKIEDKMTEWRHIVSDSVLDALGSDVGWSGDDAIAEFYPTVESVNKIVGDFSDDMSDMVFELDDTIKAARNHEMGESLTKRLETARTLMFIALDFLCGTMDRY